MKKILLMLILVLSLAGCQNMEQNEPMDEPANGEASDLIQGDSGDSSNTQELVAEVNGEKIYKSEVDQVTELMQQQGQEVDPSMVVEQLVMQKLLVQEANKRGLSVSDEEAERYLEDSLQGGMTLDDIKSQIGDRYSQLIEEQKLQILIQKVLEDEGQDTEVTQEELEQFYENNKKLMGNVTFDEAESELRTLLKQQKQQQIINDLLEELMQEAEITIEEEFQRQEVALQPQEQPLDQDVMTQ